MLHFISGKFAGTFDNGVIIENNGIGYEINMPSSSAAYMASEGDSVTVYTAMIVREDDISLYGFDDRDSLLMFRMLTGVSGIKAQGVGKKTAQRIVLELRDKIDATSITETSHNVQTSMPIGVRNGASEAIDALVSLGYSKSEAAEAVSSCGLEDAPAEEFIKAALKKLSLF